MIDQLSRLYYNKGLELLHTNKINDALIVLKKSISLVDTNISAWNLLGLCYYRLCRFKMAEYCWKESLKVDTYGTKQMSILKNSVQLI